MVLPTPAEVIATVHQLAVACKKYKGIMFTDKDGNVIDDANDDNDTGMNEVNTLEITGVDMMTEMEITEVGNNSEINDNEPYTTGVGNNSTSYTLQEWTTITLTWAIMMIRQITNTKIVSNTMNNMMTPYP